jgi:hypothetical protein
MLVTPIAATIAQPLCLTFPLELFSSSAIVSGSDQSFKSRICWKFLLSLLWQQL